MKLILAIFLIIVGLFTVALLIPDKQNYGPHQLVVEMVARSNSIIFESQNLYSNVKGSIEFSGSPSTRKMGAIDLSVSDNGVIILESEKIGDEYSIRITRTPVIKDGSVKWNCTGSPVKLMPIACKEAL